MRSLLDTHFIMWVVRGSTRLDRYTWFDRYQPWGVSPISLLELTVLLESGRLGVERDLVERVCADTRFEIDDISLLQVVRHATPLAWTRDPFDRLLAGHSAARRVPLCSLDTTILENHKYLPRELTD